MSAPRPAPCLRPLGLLALGAGAALVVTVLASCLKRRDADAEPGPPANPCVACHGSAGRDGTPEVQAAPPCDIDGNTDWSAPGVGAHEMHVYAGLDHGPVPCTECHVVPTATDSPGHADSAPPAEFVPGELARLGGRTPVYDAATHTCSQVYCHRRAEPVWNAPQAWACGTCHDLPPPPPHPQAQQCSECHGEVIDSGRMFLRPDLHCNGGVDVSGTCYSCHGTPQSFAPPPDTTGSSSVSSIGVGAHTKHLSGGSYSNPVPCYTCHVVPSYVGQIGHIDESEGAEVIFTAVALGPTWDPRTPAWDRSARRCAGSWCHAPSSAADPPSPDWTVDTGVTPPPCTTCHGMPPPLPHQQNDACPSCHTLTVEGTAPNITIKDRTLHINGTVDY